jgi:hypothetical protein
MKIQHRLRIDRIRSRSLPAFRKAHPDADGHETTILEDIENERKRQQNKRHEIHNGNACTLFKLFNENLVDEVKFVDGEYVEADFDPKATHRLVGTSWNTEPTPNMPNPRYALSVCAVPLKPKLHQTGLVIRKPIPRDAVPYKTSGSVGGKRNVLRMLLTITKAKLAPTLLLKMTSAECDQLYQQITRASRLLLFKKYLS